MKKSFSATMSIKRFAGYFIESFLSIMRWVIHVISVGAWSNPVNLDSLNQLCEEFLAMSARDIVANMSRR